MWHDSGGKCRLFRYAADVSISDNHFPEAMTKEGRQIFFPEKIGWTISCRPGWHQPYRRHRTDKVVMEYWGLAADKLVQCIKSPLLLTDRHCDPYSITVSTINIVQTKFGPSCNTRSPRSTVRISSVQEAQLSQRDRAAGWVSNGQKWKTGTERQYLRTI